MITVGLVVAFRDHAFAIALQSDLAVRIAVAVGVVAPIGFFLGMPFPIGITLANDKPDGTVAWCWAMNGLCTIVGGLMSVILSIFLGFTITLILAASLYVVAIFLLRRMFATHEVAPA